MKETAISNLTSRYDRKPYRRSPRPSKLQELPLLQVITHLGKFAIGYANYWPWPRLWERSIHNDCEGLAAQGYIHWPHSALQSGRLASRTEACNLSS